MTNLTEEQFAFLHEKYKRLIYVAAKAVKADSVMHSVQDCQQELYISMIDAAKGFEAKTGLKPEEFIDTVIFDKYLKTTIWNRKNTLGSKVTRVYKVNHALPIDAELLSVEDTECSSVNIFKDLEFDDDEVRLINASVLDPTIYKQNGKFNITKASKILQVPKTQIEHTITKLRKRLINE